MEIIEDILCILGIALAVILIVYIFMLIFMKRAVIESGWIGDGTSINNADQIYCLPTANLQIKSTAKILIVKDTVDSAIIDKGLLEISFEMTPQIIADTNTYFKATYVPSVFSNDDIKLTVSSAGFLEGVNLTAEDKIGSIVSQFTEAPKAILGSSPSTSLGVLAGTTVTTETKEFTNNFIVFAKEIRDQKASRTWIINIDGIAEQPAIIDASFDLVFASIPAPLPLSKQTIYGGVVSRPMNTIDISITRKVIPDPNAAVAVQPVPVKYWVTIPDESKIVTAPIRRSPGVKKTYGLKFTNGLLTEGTISKPSEMESLVSIPVNIAKAIVSIPAQLFSFRLESIKRQTTLETEQQALTKALLVTRKNEISNEAELLKAKVEAQKVLASYESEIIKARLDAQKTVLDAQKTLITANEDLKTTKAKWDNAKAELEAILKKIEDAKKIN